MGIKLLYYNSNLTKIIATELVRQTFNLHNPTHVGKQNLQLNISTAANLAQTLLLL